MSTSQMLTLTRRRLLGGLMGGVALAPLLGSVLSGRPAMAQDLRYFRIGTGTTAGTYFPIGGLIANAISNPPGSRPCDKGGSCGIPGLIVVAQASNGSVDNVEMLRAGTVEAGFAQADVAYWAYSGTGSFTGKRPFAELRSLGMLYAEAIQVVVRSDGFIDRMADLKGRSISLGEEGSGTLVEARLILDAYGLSESTITPLYLKPGMAADRLAKGELDGFFMVGGYPVAAVADVAARVPIRLVPLDGEPADRLLRTQRFYIEHEIPANAYPGSAPTPTLSLGAELLTRADRDPDLIYGIVRALWHENTRRVLAEGHPQGRNFDPARAVANVSVPLHPGAERFYREAGLLGNAANEPARAPTGGTGTDATPAGGEKAANGKPPADTPPAEKPPSEKSSAEKAPAEKTATGKAAGDKATR
ncbi:TAXI family TRAP transporter solute-binding subunit [Azospirillum sp. A1-3]|uniref:TAXI family TRAP transporter solute-binding subunit n=1 Tax=Azospirillum sp. A1-3 TaxID=185874 RepID=UPI0020777616|nr:TAXI family TRAP transporter solute-binding subunit [Azospirillum sp. A1-3]MCM8732750.1 TAXI family TRAP transporter solute-binding subunit [Azospirillum sp. A1-3]